MNDGEIQDGERLQVEDRQIWVRAFYGFDPEGAGYIGFTNLGDQSAMLEQMREGDIVLIYGAVEELTAQDLRAQALGFLEVSMQPCTDRERMSDESYAWKVGHGFRDRWTNGLRVTRAWRIRNRVGISNIAPEAYHRDHRFTRTTRAVLLSSAERERALSHPVKQVNVFGEPFVLDDNLVSGPMAEMLKPSPGLPPSFGVRTFEYCDGENDVYFMEYTGHATKFLEVGSCHFAESLVKIGRSNDISRRLNEINCGFPKTAMSRWKIARHFKFANGSTAHVHEDKLKEIFASRFKSQGNEFFTGRLEEMQNEFDRYCVSVQPKILGAAGKARGLR